MKKFLAAILFFVTAFSVFAQNTIRVEAPNMVGLDEQFNVTFIIEGEARPKDFNWNQGADFQLVWGPQTGSSTSIQIINGKRSKTSQYTFTYILSPKKAGTFQLPTATATISGKQWTSQEVSIEVVGNGTSGKSSSSGSSSSSSSRDSYDEEYDASTGEISSDDLFLKLTLSKRTAVVGEPITATLKLYQRVSIAGFEDAKFPNFTGFWSQETYTPQNIQFTRENINDMMYNSAVLRRYVIIPQQVGTLTIDPSELVCLVNVRAPQRHSNSIFDSFFDDGYRTVRKRISTPAIHVDVNSLPAGAPASFGGGVGSFKMSARVSKDSLKMHEAASLVVTLSGKGNVSLLDAPKVVLPPDFELYDTKTVDKTDKNTGGTSGSKSFEFPFIPRSYGDFDIEPIEYSYFDVNAGKYVQLTTEPIHIKVAKGKMTATTAAATGQTNVLPQVERKGVKNLGEDIRFIQTKMPSLSRDGKFFIGSAAYWIISVLLLLIASIIYMTMRKLVAMKADVAGSRNRGAVRMARKRLKAAQEYLSKNLYSAFYEELHRGLSDFISDKFNMQMEDLNKENISTRLHEEGIPDELTERLVKLLDACEYARYSPDSGHDAMNTDYNEAVNVISSIGSGMKGKRNNAAAVMILFMLLLPSAMLHAENAYPDSLWQAGVSAYEAGNWEKAAASWNAISGAGVESAEVYYNIGNAYYKSGEIAKAIINWERALKLDPSYNDARFNLEFAQNQIQDRIDPVPEFILKSFARKLSYLLESNSWAVLALFFFAIVIALTLVYLLSNRRGLRIAGFYTAIVSLLLSASCFGFAKWQLNDYRKADRAIVMKPVSSIKSSPSAESSKDLFVLHEGTKVEVLDRIGDWYNISLADGRQGWILAADMEII